MFIIFYLFMHYYLLVRSFTVLIEVLRARLVFCYMTEKNSFAGELMDYH